MVEIALYLAKHSALGATLILIAFVAEYVGSPTLKADVVRWMQANNAFKLDRFTLQRVLTAFLDGYVAKIFASRLSSVRFILRSALVSAGIFIAVIVLQGLFYSGSLVNQFYFLYANPVAGAAMLITALLLNWFLDYIANVKTFSLLRMASESGRLLDLVFVIFADIALTVALFVTVFPATAVAGLLIFQFFNPLATLQINSTDERTNELIELLSKEMVQSLAVLNLKDGQLYTFQISSLKPNRQYGFSSPESESKNYGYVYTFDAPGPKNSWDSYDNAVSHYIKYLGAVGHGSTAVGRHNESRAISVFQVKRDFLYGHQEIKDLYSAFSAQVNEQRRYAWEMLSLKLLFSDFGSALFDTGDWEATHGVVECDNGAFQNVNLENATRTKLPCTPKAFFPTLSIEQETLLLEIRSVMGIALPTTPFFVTSFSLAIMYYCILTLCLFGILFLSLVRYIFSSSLFNVTERPFMILALTLFPLAFTASQLAYLFLRD